MKGLQFEFNISLTPTLQLNDTQVLEWAHFNYHME